MKYLPWAESKCLRVSVENLHDDHATLQVKVGDVVDEEREVSVRPAVLTTIIETSKSVYYPEERIQMRIYTFDNRLRPVKEHLKKVWIENSRGLVVMQWDDVKTEGGILSLSAPLAQDNLLGTWKVKAITKNNVLVAERTFQVLEKDQSEFSIQMEDKPYIDVSEQDPVRTICIRNQMKQGIEGRIQVQTGYQNLNAQLPLDVFTSDVGFHFSIFSNIRFSFLHF